MFKWTSCAVSLLYKEAFWCGLIKMDTNTAGLICIWLASYLFMHNMNDGLEVSFINQTFHMKTADFDLFSCWSKQSTGPLVTWQQATDTNTEIEKIIWFFKHTNVVCLWRLRAYCLSLLCWENHMFIILLVLVLVFSFLDSQPWKSENLCWTLVIIMFYF